MDNKITQVKINKLWDIYNVDWQSINPDVNIIVGINGSGKSTILNAMFQCLNNPKEVTNNFFMDYISVTYDNYVIDSINGIPEGKQTLSTKLNREGH